MSGVQCVIMDSMTQQPQLFAALSVSRTFHIHLCLCFCVTITKDITLQHIAKMSLCGKVISSFVIFAVLDLRDRGCRP